MSNYGYDSVRKTIEELSAIPKPHSAMTTATLREAHKRLEEARFELLGQIPAHELDLLIDAYRAHNGFQRDGNSSMCVNGKTLMENFKALLPEAPKAKTSPQATSGSILRDKLSKIKKEF
ncbi:hypothetical protein [Rhizobium sp. 2MFCol3.1]|uniref:hypothetical protein n=1 Tax=Rhizobium sp. 2MFCol3.1 TaxID=1246459 RepID=UPI00037E3347|nr:hypothetical protein [Rhizobium sp. 2MFCol3.1]